MFFHPRSYRQHIGVEDNVLRTEAHLFRQDAIGTATYFNLPFVSICLPFLIKSHDDNRRAITLDGTGTFDKDRFAFFQRNGIDNAFALHAFQSGKYHIPLGRVYHNRYARDIGFRCDEVQEGGHLLNSIQQTVVHIDVNHQRSVLHLLAGDGQSFLVFFFINQPKELTRTCHITPLAYVDEIDFGRNFQQFQARKP